MTFSVPHSRLSYAVTSPQPFHLLQGSCHTGSFGAHCVLKPGSKELLVGSLGKVGLCFLCFGKWQGSCYITCHRHTKVSIMTLTSPTDPCPWATAIFSEAIPGPSKLLIGTEPGKVTGTISILSVSLGDTSQPLRCCDNQAASSLLCLLYQSNQ